MDAAATSRHKGMLERLFDVAFASQVEALADVPGPPPVFPFGNALELAQGDLHKIFERYREAYGDYVLFWVFGKPSLLVNEPELLAEILIDREADYYKNVPRDAVAPVMGSSVFRSEGGADWKEKRAEHPFEAPEIERWYASILPLVRNVVGDRMRHLVPAGGSTHTDFFDDLHRMSFQVFGNAVLGHALSPQDFDDHGALLHEISVRGALPVPISLSPEFWFRRNRWLRMIEERIATPAPDAAGQAPSLVAHFKHVMKAAKLGPEHFRDEVSNVFTAGMKNVAIAAAAVIFQLARHPDVLAKLLDELKAAGGAPTLAALEGMAYLDRVAKETLRLLPVVPGFVREVKPGKGVHLGGHALPDGTQIFITPWTVHHHPEIWPDPLRFDPDRFLEAPPPHHYLPFGMGARSCVGERFTWIATKAMVVEILSRYTVDVDAACTFDTTLVAGTIPPVGGMPSRVTERRRRT